MINFAELDFNDEFVAAFEALENTGQHIFVTGKAGTGKSTLLQYFREKTTKNVAVLAPTGVAAINIKGQTIHSFFGFKPDVTPESVGDIPVRKRRQKMYRELSTVIIDEISMVRADLMDCIDLFLRLYGPFYDRPFGGIQMLFFGDLFQLPPVVGRGEEDIFKTHYPTPYFFSAKVFESLDFKSMQLQKIYRQKDEGFIRLLNAVRDDSLEEHHWEKLNGRFKPALQSSLEDFYIVLTTTNALADKVNMQRLQGLTGFPRIYQGVVSGEFERKSLPTPETLELKVGAQVMMLNNDTDKRWVNGSLGKILKIVADTEGDDVIMVELENGTHIDVKKHTWEIYQYYFDEDNKSLGSRVMGYFTQYPLKLAWAVTIHKSQGQTFERVIIDIGWGTFSHGQMYVALSRCTSLEGIVLKQPLNQRHILMDERVVEFMRNFIFLLFLPFLLVPAWAQTPSLDRTQAVVQDLSKIEDKQVNPNAWVEKNSDQPYIGLLAETDTEIHDDWSFDEVYHFRVRIQKDSAKNLGQWPIYYNKSRSSITQVKAFIETPEGKKLEATDIKDLPAYEQSVAYDDLRLKVITFPAISLGAIMDIQIKTKFLREEIPNQFWDEVIYPSIPTKYTRYTYTFPKNKSVQYHAFNSDKQPLIENANGKTKYSYIFENTNYNGNVDFMPPVQDVVGDLSLSTINDWKIVVDWWRDMINKNTVDDPAINAKVQELVKDKSVPKDKAHAILEFIQDNFRFIAMTMGDYTVGMHPTAEVYKNHYGDCKDLALLARQMLKIAGIDANICLFSSEFNGDPQRRLPNPAIFDYVLLDIIIDGQHYFVDPQAKGFDLGELPSSYDNSNVLEIEASAYHFQKIPLADGSFHAMNSTNDIFVHEDGSADFQVDIKMPTEAAAEFRKNWDPSSDASKRKFFDNLQATFGQGGKITEHDVKGLDSRYGPLEFNFKYSAQHVYQVVNNMVLVKEEQQGSIPDFAEDTRKYPIYVPTNSSVLNRNIYHIPADLRILPLPQDYHLSSDFMEVNVKFSKVNDTVTVDSNYQLKHAIIPLQGLPGVKKFREDLSKKSMQYIVLMNKSNASSETKGWIRKQ